MGSPKPYGDKLLFENLSFSLPQRWECWKLIGANGAGKTKTLFKIDHRSGETWLRKFRSRKRPYSCLYVDAGAWQSRSNKVVLSESQSLMQMTDEAGNRRSTPEPYVSKFNFRWSDQEKKVRVLSVGERKTRVHLATDALKRTATYCYSMSLPTTGTWNTLRSFRRSLRTLVAVR